MTIRQLVKGYVDGKEQYRQVLSMLESEENDHDGLSGLVESLQNNPAQEFLRRDFDGYDDTLQTINENSKEQPETLNFQRSFDYNRLEKEIENDTALFPLNHTMQYVSDIIFLSSDICSLIEELKTEYDKEEDYFTEEDSEKLRYVIDVIKKIQPCFDNHLNTNEHVREISEYINQDIDKIEENLDPIKIDKKSNEERQNDEPISSEVNEILEYHREISQNVKEMEKIARENEETLNSMISLIQ